MQDTVEVVEFASKAKLELLVELMNLADDKIVEVFEVLVTDTGKFLDGVGLASEVRLTQGRIERGACILTSQDQKAKQDCDGVRVVLFVLAPSATF
jgi:hypothetical protein